jgi:hypothetical protein
VLLGSFLLANPQSKLRTRLGRLAFMVVVLIAVEGPQVMKPGPCESGECAGAWVSVECAC